MNKHNKYPRLILLALCGFNLLFSTAFAAERVLDATQSEQTPVSLTPYFSTLEDAGMNLTLDDVQQADVAARFKMDAPAGDALSFGYTRSAYWLRLTLRNTGKLPLERMLELGYAGLSAVEFYQPAAKGAYQLVLPAAPCPFRRALTNIVTLCSLSRCLRTLSRCITCGFRQRVQCWCRASCGRRRLSMRPSAMTI